MFKLLKLEDRIVLDGAAIGDLMDEAQAHDQREDMLQEMAQARDGDSPDGDGPDGDAHDFDTHEPLFIDDGFMEDAPDSQEADGVRVLVISSELEDGDDLASAVKDGVIVVEYDAEKTGLDDLAKLIDEALGDQKADSIAFASHNSGDGEIQLTQPDRLSAPEYQDFWKQIGELVEDGGRIDLLACNVVEDAEGERFLSSLEEYSGTNVAASTDKTGNEAYGGDWVLEEPDGVDVQDSYFDAEKLEEFEGLLEGEPGPNSNIADVGVYRGAFVFHGWDSGVFANDPDLDDGSLSYTVDTSGAPFMTYMSSYHAFWGYAPYTPGNYTISVTADDSDGNPADARTEEFDIVVAPAGVYVPVYNNPHTAYTNPNAAYQISAWDPDWSTVWKATDNDDTEATLTYEIKSGNLDSAFKIDDDGKISVNNPGALDYEKNPYFALMVQVEDDDGLPDWARITIRLTEDVIPPDLPDLSILQDGPVSFDEGGSTTVKLTVDEAFASQTQVVIDPTGDADYFADYTIVGASDLGDGTLGINFPGSVTEHTITLNAVDDSDTEPAEDIELNLAASPNYNLSTPTQQTVTINESDAPLEANLQVVGNDYFPEDGSTTVRVNLNELAPNNMTVYLEYSDKAGDDPGYIDDYKVYQGATLLSDVGGYLPVLINAGASSAELKLEGVADGIQEGPEAVNLTIHTDAAYDYVAGADSQKIVTITDNDSPPIINLELANGSAFSEGYSTVVRVNLSHPAPDGFTLNLDYSTNTDGAVLNQDYEVYRSDIQIVDGDGDGDLEFSVAASQESFDIELKALIDGVDEGDENFSLAVNDAASTDYEAGGTASQTLTVLDTELTAKPIVALALNDKTLYEDNSLNPQATLQAVLSRPAPQDMYVYVDYVTTSGYEAEHGVDYTGDTRIFVKGGDMAGKIYPTGLTDMEIEGDEKYQVTLVEDPLYTLSTDTSETTLEGTVKDTSNPTVWLEGDGNVFSESDSAGSMLTLNLNAPSDDNIGVTLNFSGIATPETDYTAKVEGVTKTIVGNQLTVTIPANETDLDVQLIPVDDSKYEGDLPESIEVDIADAVNAFVHTDPAMQDATAAIVDNDESLMPKVELAIKTGFANTFDEDGANNQTVIQAQLSSPNLLTDDVVVYLEPDAASVAELGVDYTYDQPYDGNQWEIHIAPGLQTGSLTLTGLSDDKFEGAEELSVSIADAVYAVTTGLNDTVSATILESTPGPTVKLSPLNPTRVAETGPTSAQLDVSLESESGAVDADLKVYLQPNTDDALYEQDYTVAGATVLTDGRWEVVFSQGGATTQSLTLTAVDDNIWEGGPGTEEAFQVTVKGTDAGTTGGVGDFVTGAVEDNDPMPVDPTVYLTPSSFDFYENAGDGPQVYSINVNMSDPSPEDTTVTLSFGGDATIPAAGDDYTVSVGGSTQDIAGNGNQLTVVIPSGETVVPVALTGMTDIVAEGTELVTVELSNVNDPSLIGFAASTVPAEVNITGALIDDFEGDQTVNLVTTSTDLSFDEDGVGYLFKVQLDHKTSEPVTVTLDYTPQDDSPGQAYPYQSSIDEGDYKPSTYDPATKTTTVTISTGSAYKAVSLVPNDDFYYEGNEPFNVSISAVAGGGVAIGATDNVDLTIVDDETPASPPVVELFLEDTVSRSDIYNEAEQGRLLVHLDRAYTFGDVTAHLALGGDADYSGSQLDYTLTFHDGTRDVQTGTFDVIIPAGQQDYEVTLDILDDGVYEPGDYEEINVDFNGTADGAIAVGPAVTGFIDDQSPQPKIKLSIVNQEGNFYENPQGTDQSSELVIKLEMDGKVDNDVFVDLDTVTDDFSASATDYTVITPLTNIKIPAGSTGVTFTLVEAKLDTAYEGNEHLGLKIGDITDPDVTFDAGNDTVTATLVDDITVQPVATMDVVDALTFGEDGDGATLTIGLDKEVKGADVTITLAFSDPGGVFYPNDLAFPDVTAGEVGDDLNGGIDYAIYTDGGAIGEAQTFDSGSIDGTNYPYLYNVVITDGQQEVDVWLRGVNDSKEEGDEPFTVEIVDGLGAQVHTDIDERSDRWTVIDDDYTRPELELKFYEPYPPSGTNDVQLYESVPDINFGKLDLYLKDGQLASAFIPVEAMVRFEADVTDTEVMGDFIVEDGGGNTQDIIWLDGPDADTDADYGLVHVQIPGGQNGVTLSVKAVSDSMYEGNEFVNISYDVGNFTNALNDVNSDFEATATIVDVAADPIVELAFPDSDSFYETGDTTMMLQIRDGIEVGQDTHVTLKFSEGDVTDLRAHVFTDGNGNDWRAADYTVSTDGGATTMTAADVVADDLEGFYTFDLVIPAGETAVEFTLAGVDDLRYEGAQETFTVQITSATSGAYKNGGTQMTDTADPRTAFATGTILDDDPEPEVELTVEPSGATYGDDAFLEFDDGSNPTEIHMTLSIGEGSYSDSSVLLNFGGEADPATAAGEEGDYSVFVDGEFFGVTDTLWVSFDVEDGISDAAEASHDIKLVAITDEYWEQPWESVDVSIVGDTTNTIQGPIANDVDDHATARLIDDDKLPEVGLLLGTDDAWPPLDGGVDDLSFDEGETVRLFATVPYEVGKPLDVTVAFGPTGATDDRDALIPDDYKVNSPQTDVITIPAGETLGFISIKAFDDGLYESNEVDGLGGYATFDSENFIASLVEVNGSTDQVDAGDVVTGRIVDNTDAKPEVWLEFGGGDLTDAFKEGNTDGIPLYVNVSGDREVPIRVQLAFSDDAGDGYDLNYGTDANFYLSSDGTINGALTDFTVGAGMDQVNFDIFDTTSDKIELRLIGVTDGNYDYRTETDDIQIDIVEAFNAQTDAGSNYEQLTGNLLEGDDGPMVSLGWFDPSAVLPSNGTLDDDQVFWEDATGPYDGTTPAGTADVDIVGLRLQLVDDSHAPWVLDLGRPITVEVDFNDIDLPAVEGNDFYVITSPQFPSYTNDVTVVDGKALFTFETGPPQKIEFGIIPEDNEDYIGDRLLEASISGVSEGSVEWGTDSWHTHTVAATIIEDETAPKVDLAFATPSGLSEEYSFGEGEFGAIVATQTGNSYGKDITVGLEFGGEANFSLTQGTDYYPLDEGVSHIVIPFGKTQSDPYYLLAEDDLVHEAHEEFTVDIGVVTGGEEVDIAADVPQVTGTILDDDPGPAVGMELETFLPGDGYINENGGYGLLTVTMDGVSNIDETVTLRLDGDATPDVDQILDQPDDDYSMGYQDTAGNAMPGPYTADMDNDGKAEYYLEVMIPAGETQVDVELKSIHDGDTSPPAAYEETEDIKISVHEFSSLMSNTPADVDTETAIIVDDDAKFARRVFLNPIPDDFTEDGGQATLGVQLDDENTAEITVTLSLSDSEASYSGSTDPATLNELDNRDFDITGARIAYYTDAAQSGGLQTKGLEDAWTDGEFSLVIPAGSHYSVSGVLEPGVGLVLEGRSDELYEGDELIDVQIADVKAALPALNNTDAQITIVDDVDFPNLQIKTAFDAADGYQLTATGDTADGINTGQVDEVDQDYTVSLTVYRDHDATNFSQVFWKLEQIDDGIDGNDNLDVEDYVTAGAVNNPFWLGYEGTDGGQDLDIVIKGDQLDENLDADTVRLSLYASQADLDGGVNELKRFDLDIQDAVTDADQGLSYDTGYTVQPDDTPYANTAAAPDFHVDAGTGDSQLVQGGTVNLSTDDLFFYDDDAPSDNTGSAAVDENGLSIRYIVSEAPQHGVLYLETDGAGDGFNEGDTLLSTGDDFNQDDIIQGRLWYEHKDPDALSDSFLFSVADDVNVSTGPEIGQAFDTGTDGADDLFHGDGWVFNFYASDTAQAPVMQDDDIIFWVDENQGNTPVYFDQNYVPGVDEAIIATDPDGGADLLASTDTRITEINGETDSEFMDRLELYAVDGDKSQVGLKVKPGFFLKYEDVNSFLIDVTVEDETGLQNTGTFYLRVNDVLENEYDAYPIADMSVVSDTDFIQPVEIDTVFPDQAERYYFSAVDHDTGLDATNSVANWFHFDTNGNLFWYDHEDADLAPDFDKVFDITVHAEYYNGDGAQTATPTVIEAPAFQLDYNYVASLDMDLMNAPDAELMDALEYLEGDDDGILPAEGEDGLPVNDVMVADAPAEAPVEGLENKSEFDEVLALLDGDGLDTTADLMEMQEIIVAEDINRKLDSDRA